MPGDSADLYAALRRHFGFDSFRPLQEAIIRDALAGRDVLAILPTGGGKSLCFQLPALVEGGLTLVVSPLIALMKDQVDALQAAGAPATLLNSSVEPSEARARLAGLREGRYRLLYVAPERLMLPAFLGELARMRVVRIAVDEAHCISEWGHDFRPEYRRLAELRAVLPHAATMALTATATPRVREDVLRLLRLRDPVTYVASFNRPNLAYRVAAKTRAYDQALAFVRARGAHESGIVYCQSRASVDRVAERLRADGVRAHPYHAGLGPAERERHQEMFLRDDVQVVVATIAFGLGINKPNVRWVMHYDLPKSIEAYYQETGRAGRDGLPAECLLLFRPGDATKQARFIDEKPDAREREIARGQLQRMIDFAEGAECRRADLLGYFGETFEDIPCRGCDNCLAPRESYDGTLLAQKLLSCVVRIRQKGGFGVGANHVAEVLTGADTERVRRWSHRELSTYGIGKDRTREEWKAIARELCRLGHLRSTGGDHPVLEITAEGLDVLVRRQPVTLTRSVAAERASARHGEIACDEALFERLRALRKRLADERDVPAYVVFSDVTLRQMARVYPASEAELSRVNGVGEKKLADFGSVFLEAIAGHLVDHPKLTFSDEAPPLGPPPVPLLGPTARETSRLFRDGMDVVAIARARRLAETTIWSHLADAVAAGEPVDVDRLWTAEQARLMAAAFDELGGAALKPVRDRLGEGFEYGVLSVFRAARLRERR